MDDIDAWHKARGFLRGKLDSAKTNPALGHIGYHFVIYTNGAIASGRGLDEVGAHAQGFNRRSVGICLVGTDAFTPAQWASLTALLASLQKRYPGARVAGHRQLPEVHKDCPGFDVAAWQAGGMVPPADGLLEVS